MPVVSGRGKFTTLTFRGSKTTIALKISHEYYQQSIKHQITITSNISKLKIPRFLELFVLF
jgi:hypothetical protein